jgi:hypothetical protein
LVSLVANLLMNALVFNTMLEVDFGWAVLLALVFFGLVLALAFIIFLALFVIGMALGARAFTQRRAELESFPAQLQPQFEVRRSLELHHPHLVRTGSLLSGQG